MHLAFGESWQAQDAIALFQDLGTGEALPKIEILSTNELGANGAFAKETNTIYIAAEFLDENITNLEAVTTLVLEETGHFIDSQLNDIDSSGDEGAIFAALVQGNKIPPSELLALKAEDDSGTLTVDGQTIEVEHSSDEPGVFTVGDLGDVSIEFLTDAGSYVGELGIFSLQGMEDLTPGSVEFIQESARRALSDSELGYVVISDSVEGGRFSGELGESDKNAGEYSDVEFFFMNPDEEFAVMFTPDGTIEEVFSNPVIDGNKRPLFSIAAANPNNAIQMGQFVEGSVDGGVFAFEDIRLDQTSDQDYNDIIFKIGGASGFATSLEELIVADKEWQNTDLGQKLRSFAAEDLSTAVDLGTLTSNKTLNGFVGNDNFTDVYSFTLDTASNVTINLSGLSADADLVLIEDINANGLSDEDFPGLEEIIEVSELEGTVSESIDILLQAGEYFIEVEQYEGDTNYDLSLNATPFVPPTDTIPNTIPNAFDLGVINDTQVEVSEHVGSTDTVDYFKFTLDTQSDLDLELTDLSANVDIRLIQDADENGRVDDEEVIDFASSPGDEDKYIFVPDLEEGDYFIELENVNGEAMYNLGLDVTASTTPPDNAGNSLSEAKDLGNLNNAGNINFSDSVNVRDVKDFYEFTLTETSEFNLSLTGITSDADVYLIKGGDSNDDEDTEEIIAASTLKTGDEEIKLNLAAGSYIIEVFDVLGDTNYNLELSATPTTEDPTPTTPDEGSTLRSAIAQDDPNFEVSGNVSDTNQSQFYKFTVKESGIFTADLTDLTEDADVRLIRDYNGNNSIDLVEDRNGNIYLDKEEIEVIAWQPNRDDNDESIRAFLDPGDYFLEVNSPKKETTDYDVATEFTPAIEDPLEFKINVEFTDEAKSALDVEHTDSKQDEKQTLQQTVIEAANYWSRVITHSTFDNKVHEVQVEIDAKDQGKDTLAAAGPLYYTEPNLERNPKDANGFFMPDEGSGSINTFWEIFQEYQDDVRYLYETMIHEFGHVLGFLGSSPKEIRDEGAAPISWNDRNLVDLSDPENPLYKSETFASIAYGELLGTNEPTTIPLTRNEGSGSDYAHWWGKVFGQETSVESGEAGKPARFSTISIASARDLGYNVNYGAAEPYTLPKLKT